MSRVGNLIKERREALNLTQVEFAQRIGVGGQFISNIERGVCLPPKKRAGLFAKHLGIPVYTVVRAMQKDWAEQLR